MTSHLALLDWDFTLHDGFTMLDWCLFLDSSGAFDQTIAAQLTDAFAAYSAGELSYRTLWERAPIMYGQGLAGQRVQLVRRLAAQFVQRDEASLYDFTIPTMKLLADLQIPPVVVSGAPEEVLYSYEGRLRWSRVFGVSVAKEDGVYLPALTENPATAESKRRIVSAIIADRRVVVAFGDSEADIPMLEAAHIKVVVGNSDPIAAGPNVLHLRHEWSSELVVEKLGTLLDRAMPEQPGCK